MKAVIYTRFSPRPKDKQDICDSCDRQRALCEKLSRARKWPVLTFDDPAESGAEEDRPVLWSAVEALSRGDVLLVWKLDRLARDPHLFWLIEREVEKKGARILSTTGEGTESEGPEGKLIRDVLAAVSAWERRVIAARTKAAMLWKQDAGLRVSYRLPYGWSGDPTNPKRIVREEDEQRIIAMVVSYHGQGYTLRAICAGLKSQGLQCRGHEFHHENVRRILRRAARQGAAAKEGGK